jgi:hypothetical protein
MPLRVTRIEPRPDEVIGASVVAIGHSEYGKPEFVVEGIGPAVFRSHFVSLSSGVVLDLFTAEITKAQATDVKMPGETAGLPVEQVIRRTVTALARDDVHSALIILEDQLYLRDANDGFTGNPLRAGRLTEEYTEAERRQFLDYWTEEPLVRGGA